MLAAPRTVARRQLGQVAARSFASSPWGGDAWRHDKTAFKNLITNAARSADAPARRELYGYLSISFGDVDADKDGYINADEFDTLLEKVAGLPRRYGLAPTWTQEFGGDVAKRTASRRAIFDQLDTASGLPARNKLGLAQFVNWAYDHIFMKEKTIDHKKVDPANLGSSTEAEFVAYMDECVNKHGSGASTTFYNFLLTTFVEADTSNTGKISEADFDKLIEQAAKAPRFFGLAPQNSSKEERKAIFDIMDDNKTGHVTFRKFLKWTMKHVRGKVADHKAGKGYKK